MPAMTGCACRLGSFPLALPAEFTSAEFWLATALMDWGVWPYLT
jgi:hypothetical protein